MEYASIAQWILGIIIVLSALFVITAKKPVHACLSFLLTLLSLASLYLQLSAPFISVMQILVYAGAILVIFMFVIVLFQDAYQQIHEHKAQSKPLLLFTAVVFLVGTLTAFCMKTKNISFLKVPQKDTFGTVEAIGKALYVDFFFPFEAVSLLFLVAIIGALYIGKKV